MISVLSVFHAFGWVTGRNPALKDLVPLTPNILLFRGRMPIEETNPDAPDAPGKGC